jgi:OmpA-OmpF porin, OOP family
MRLGSMQVRSFNQESVVTKKIVIAAFAAFSTSAVAQYATQSGTGEVWKNPYGLCWHSAFWTPDQAIEGCDAVARPAPVAAPKLAPPVQEIAEVKTAPAPEPVAQEPAPAPVAAAAPQPSYEKVTLSADVLFDFGKSTLKDAGKAKLDELADRLSGATLDEIKIVGHADRIGSAQSNKRLSEARAETVRTYLQTRTQARTFEISGRGSDVPVSNCKGLGADQGSNRRLVQCLQADRRVEIELFGVRTAAQRPADSAAGSTQPTNFSR